MKRLAEFGREEEGERCEQETMKSEMNRDTLKSLMSELERCESAIADCFSRQTNKPTD